MGDRGLKFAKDGYTVESTNPDHYNLWTKYPPLGLLEKKTTTVTIQGAGCSLAIDTKDVPHDYDFIPLVIGTAEKQGTGVEELMPIVPDFYCDFTFPVSSSFINYRVYDDRVQIRSYAACAIMGFEECPVFNVTYNINLYFYLWELGSIWQPS